MSSSEDRVSYPAEQELASAVAAGDRTASEAFARRLLPVVKRVSRALLTDPDDAEDATQVSLLDVLGAARNYRGAGRLEAWAHRIATRSTLRWVRQQRQRRARASRVDPVLEPATASLSTTVIEELPRPLEEYLAALPDVQSTALVLRYSLGHTIPEISELTDAAIPTVKSRVQKAQHEIRRMIRRDLNLGAPRKASTP